MYPPGARSKLARLAYIAFCALLKRAPHTAPEATKQHCDGDALLKHDNCVLQSSAVFFAMAVRTLT
jgi:hypothetical protein